MNAVGSRIKWLLTLFLLAAASVATAGSLSARPAQEFGNEPVIPTEPGLGSSGLTGPITPLSVLAAANANGSLPEFTMRNSGRIATIGGGAVAADFAWPAFLAYAAFEGIYNRDIIVPLFKHMYNSTKMDAEERRNWSRAWRVMKEMTSRGFNRGLNRGPLPLRLLFPLPARGNPPPMVSYLGTVQPNGACIGTTCYGGAVYSQAQNRGGSDISGSRAVLGNSGASGIKIDPVFLRTRPNVSSAAVTPPRPSAPNVRRQGPTVGNPTINRMTPTTRPPNVTRPHATSPSRPNTVRLPQPAAPTVRITVPSR